MKPATKVKQIAVRFEQPSYDQISKHAKIEHRGIGEFVRHAALDYIEKSVRAKEISNRKGGESHEKTNRKNERP